MSADPQATRVMHRIRSVRDDPERATTDDPHERDIAESDREGPITHLKWVFVLDGDVEFNLKPYLPKDFSEGCAFQDRCGVRRLEIDSNGTARILQSYAWDGCTPKFSFWDIVIGIPDGRPHATSMKPKAYYASLMHDTLYQFLGNGLPFSRATADRIFLDLLAEEDFKPRRIYYAMVRTFGWAFLLFFRWKREYDGKRVGLGERPDKSGSVRKPEPNPAA